MAGTVLAAALLVSSNAFADPTPAPEEPREPETRSYAEQTLIVDGVAVGLAIAALGTNQPHGSGQTSDTLAGLSATTFGLGAPIVHFIHGRVGTGFASLGIRLGAGLLADGIGALAWGFTQPNYGDDPNCTMGQQASYCYAPKGANVGFTYGLLIGEALPMILDAAVFAHEPKKSETKAHSFTLEPRVGILPRGGAFAGVGGTL